MTTRVQPYSATVLDHFAAPRNLGRLPEANGRGVAGDLVTRATRIEIALRIEGGVVRDARFRAIGCSATIAAASLATTLLIDHPVDEAAGLTAAALVAALGGLPPERLYAPDLVIAAITAALDSWRLRDEGIG
jgi:nitrogen fixation NifU-like protein